VLKLPECESFLKYLLTNVFFYAKLLAQQQPTLKLSGGFKVVRFNTNQKQGGSKSQICHNFETRKSARISETENLPEFGLGKNFQKFKLENLPEFWLGESSQKSENREAI